MNHGRASKRRRRRPPTHYHSVTAAEERFLQQAIQNSKLDKGRPPDFKLQVDFAPTFYPTIEDFEGNPLDYIEKIRPIAERYGICKIVPPEGWNPAPFGVNLDSQQRFQTKRQFLHKLQEGISFGDGIDYTLQEYQQVASQRAKDWKDTYYPNHDLLIRHSDALLAKGEGNEDEKKKQQQLAEDQKFTPENLERDFWNIVETHSKEVAVEYGNDVDTSVFASGFPLSERGRSVCGTKNYAKMSQPEPKFGTDDYYKETWWNVNNIPFAPNSVLRHVKVGINGINVPWLYYGSLFSTFCWHNEDNYLYSINYHHRGAPKQWYGVPGNKIASDGLEKVFKSYLSMKMRDVPDLLHHITTMFSPRLLQNAEVPVHKLIQYEGEYVFTFPRSFHGGFSYGPNIGEAVNFATHDWIAYGADANERYRSFARPAVFSHDRLTFTMANHLKEQKSHSNCKLLLEELERVVDEELSLRQNLLDVGVRDVRHLISLPTNVLDQLDETSAAYDDKRLCHACKHVCFFSAVACECSQSKVSCLRHSHYMCRCPNQRKYFMIWSSAEELTATLERVRNHCESLKTLNDNADEGEKEKARPSPKIAPGVEKDLLRHRNEEISTDPIGKHSFLGKLLANKTSSIKSVCSEHDVSSPKKIRTDESSNSFTRRNVSVSSVSLDETAFADEEEVEIIGIKAPSF